MRFETSVEASMSTSVRQTIDPMLGNLRRVHFRKAAAGAGLVGKLVRTSSTDLAGATEHFSSSVHLTSIFLRLSICYFRPIVECAHALEQSTFVQSIRRGEFSGDDRNQIIGTPPSIHQISIRSTKFVPNFIETLLFLATLKTILDETGWVLPCVSNFPSLFSACLINIHSLIFGLE